MASAVSLTNSAIECEENNSQFGTMNTVEALFFKFGVIYLDAWASKLQNDEWEAALKSEWLAVVQTMTKFEITTALNFLRSARNIEFIRFPPNALTFRLLGNPKYHEKLPTIELCYNAAMRGDWSLHPVLYEAATTCDLHQLRQIPAEKAKAMLKTNLSYYYEKYLTGAEIKSAPLKNALPAEKTIEAKNETKQFQVSESTEDAAKRAMEHIRNQDWFKRGKEHAKKIQN